MGPSEAFRHILLQALMTKDKQYHPFQKKSCPTMTGPNKPAYIFSTTTRICAAI